MMANAFLLDRQVEGLYMCGCKADPLGAVSMLLEPVTVNCNLQSALAVPQCHNARLKLVTVLKEPNCASHAMRIAAFCAAYRLQNIFQCKLCSGWCDIDVTLCQ